MISHGQSVGPGVCLVAQLTAIQ